LIRENFRKHSNGIEVPPYEYTIINKAGEKIEAINSSRLIQYEGQTAILGVVTDITERKYAETALRQSEEKFNKAFYCSPDAVTISTLEEGRFIAANNAVTQVIGYTSDEIIGKTSEELRIWSHLEDRNNMIEMLKKDSKIQNKELQFRHKSGEIRHLILSADTIELEGEDCIITVSRDITERKHLEEAYHSLVDNSLQGLAIVQDGRVVFLNKAFYSTTDYSREDFLNASPEEFQSIVHPDDRELVWSRHRDRLAGKPVPPRYDCRWIRKDGSTCCLELYASRIEYHGRPAIQVAYIDITERKQAEEALKESEEKYRSVIENADLGVVVIQDGERVFYNSKVYEMLGYTEQEYGERDMMSLIHPADRTLASERMRQRFDGTVTKSDLMEIRLLSKSGEIKWIEANSAMIQWNGRPALQSFVFDITERKKSEEEIERIFNMTDYMICIASLDGYFKRINSSFEQILGYSSEELLKKPFFDFIHNDDKEKTKNVVEEELSRGSKVIGFENRYRCKDGSYKWLSWTSHPVVDEGITYAIAYDITDRKKAQEKLLEYQTQLKSLASELLLAEERERRRIATGVHDDIGQKLALVKLELQSIQAIASKPDISESLSHACELIDKGMQDARSLAFDLSNPVLYEVGFVAAVESLLTEQMIQKVGIKSELESKTRKLKLAQDTSVVLFQAVRELLTNVVKHANANKVKVCIDKSDKRAHVIVEDDGVGFELSRLKSPDKEKGGFGLFNVKERLEYLGGSFDINSKPNQGTRVTMAVPLESGVTAS
jgi:PAS domain S-box-containing protein